jgi:hypothetical protein
MRIKDQVKDLDNEMKSSISMQRCWMKGTESEYKTLDCYGVTFSGAYFHCRIFWNEPN